MNSKYTIPLAIIIGGVIVAAAVYLSIAKPSPRTRSGNGDPNLVRPIGPNDHILGNPAARAMIVEYSDFDCDFCKGFQMILHQVVANEGADGSVAWVFREFPLVEIHTNALKHAEAAECVAAVSGNDAFWKFADALFTHQPADPASYGELAAAAGADGARFAECYSAASSTVDARIMADRQNALDMGAIGTPYAVILVAGKQPIVIDQQLPYDAIKTLLNTVLQQR